MFKDCDTYVDILEHVVGQQNSDARRDEDRTAVISRRIAHKRVVQISATHLQNIHAWLLKLLRTVHTKCQRFALTVWAIHLYHINFA